jgi:hypothetical protein
MAAFPAAADNLPGAFLNNRSIGVNARRDSRNLAYTDVYLHFVSASIKRLFWRSRGFPVMNVKGYLTIG